jgi:hypothetical protein
LILSLIQPQHNQATEIKPTGSSSILTTSAT